MYDGTALGCIGRCKDCGKAIQLRRFVLQPPGMHPAETDEWVHFVQPVDDHGAVLSPGVGAYYDDQIASQQSERHVIGKE